VGAVDWAAVVVGGAAAGGAQADITAKALRAITSVRVDSKTEWHMSEK
jgi:hypothetical protein